MYYYNYYYFLCQFSKTGVESLHSYLKIYNMHDMLSIYFPQDVRYVDVN